MANHYSDSTLYSEPSPWNCTKRNPLQTKRITKILCKICLFDYTKDNAKTQDSGCKSFVVRMRRFAVASNMAKSRNQFILTLLTTTTFDIAPLLKSWRKLVSGTAGVSGMRTTSRSRPNIREISLAGVRSGDSANRSKTAGRTSAYSTPTIMAP